MEFFQDRIVSVRECARSQGFPDSIQFHGDIQVNYYFKIFELFSTHIEIRHGFHSYLFKSSFFGTTGLSHTLKCNLIIYHYRMFLREPF